MPLPRFVRKYLALKRIANERPFNLASLSADLRADEEVVLKSLPSFPWNFEHAAEELQSNPSFLRTAIEACPDVMKYVPGWVQDNKEYVMLAVERSPKVLRFVNTKFLDDKDVVLLAIATETRKTGGGVSESPTYAVASERLKLDPEVKEAAKRYTAQTMQVAEWHARR